MAHRMRWIVGALLVIVCLAMPVVAQEKGTGNKTPLLEDLIPSGSMAIATCPDVVAAIGNYRQTVPGKCIEYFFGDEFKKLLRHLGVKPGRGEFPDFRKEIDEGLKKEAGLTLDELLGLFSGECAIALVDISVDMKVVPEDESFGPPPVKGDMVAKIGWSDAAKGEALLKRLMKKATDVKESEVAGYRTYTFKEEPGVTPSLAITPACLLFTTQPARQKAILNALKTGKAVDKPLTSDAEYQIAAKNVRREGADALVYIHWAKIREFPLLKTAIEMNVPDLLGDLGVESLKSISYAFHARDARMSERVFFHVPKEERTGLMKIVSTPRTETADGILLTGEGDLGGLTGYGGGVPAIAIIAAIAVPSLMKSQTASNEKSAIGSLKMLREMSAIFKNEDPDRNTINDFWTADVSGLYRVLNAAGNEIRKIDIPLALADGAPIAPIAGYVGTPLGAVPVPKAGYYFRAMTTDETGSAYRLNALTDADVTLTCNTNKFAFCAYPVEYGKTGRHVFIVSQECTVWKKDLGSATPVLIWPASNPKTAGWSTTD